MATHSEPVLRTSCKCGICVVEMRALPKVRLNCHCTICQAFTGEAYSDVAIIPAFRAVIKNGDSIAYEKYKKFRLPPPNLSRGRCRKCNQPFIETWGFGPMNLLLFVRTPLVDEPELLPVPEAHIFYEHHIADMNDGVPRHFGYFDSMGSLATMIMHSL